MYAVQRGNPEVIRLVLKFGADTTDYDNVGSWSRVAKTNICYLHRRYIDILYDTLQAGKTVEDHIASTCRSKEEIAELLREVSPLRNRMRLTTT